jgi:hypothetical protein
MARPCSLIIASPDQRCLETAFGRSFVVYIALTQPPRKRARRLLDPTNTLDVQWLGSNQYHNGLIICITSPAAESSAMTSQRQQFRHTGKCPPGSPAEWLADGHVTCNIQCSGGTCNRRMVDVRLDTLS